MAATTSRPLAALHTSLSAQAPSVRLDREVLGDERLSGLWHRLVGQDALVLDEAHVGAADDRGWFRIVGVMPFPGLGSVPVEVTVFGTRVGDDEELEGEGNEQVEILLGVAGPVASWKPSDALVGLTRTMRTATGEQLTALLHDVELPAVTLVFSSHDFSRTPLADPELTRRATIAGRAVVDGLNLDATLDTSGPHWQAVAAIVGLDARHPVGGAIREDEHGRFVQLRLPLDGASWHPAPHLGVDVDAVLVEFALSGHRPVQPAFAVTGHLDVTRSVPVLIETAAGDPTARLSVATTGQALALDGVVAALGLDAGITAALPAGLGTVGLVALELEVDLAPPSVRRLHLSVAAAKPIELLDETITVVPSVVVDVTDPFGRDVDGSVVLSGVWGLGASSLAVGLTLPERRLSAALRPGSTLDTAAALNDLLPGAPELTLGLSELSLSADTATGGVEVRLTADEALRLALGDGELAVTNVELSASRLAAGATPTWTARGSLEVAGVHLLVDAEHGAATGWVVDARGSVDDPLDLAALIEHLIGRFPGEGEAWPPGLPEEYATARLLEMVVHFDSGDAALQVYVDLELDVRALHGVTFTHLTTAVEFDEDGLIEGWVEAGLEIAGIELQLETRYTREDGLHFHGGTDAGQRISLEAVLSEVAGWLGADATVPDVLSGLVIVQLEVTLDVAGRDLDLHLHGVLPGTDDVEVDLLVSYTRATSDGVTTAERHVHGQLLTAGLRFDMDLAAAPSRATLVATATVHGPLDLVDLAGGIDADLAELIPEGLQLHVEEVVLIHQRPLGGSRTVLGVDLSAGIDLSGLPLLGQALRSPLGIVFQPLIASRRLPATEVAALAALLGDGPIRLPEEGLPSGVQMESSLRVAERTFRLGLPLGLSDDGSLDSAAAPAAQATPTAASPDAEADGVKWFAIGRSLGPAHLSRIGLGFVDGEVSVALDGSVALGPLTLELLGLGASARLDHPVPTFHLHGLGLDYRSGDIEVGGAFLRRPVVRDGVTEDEYAGKAVLKTPEFSLTALGAYGNHAGHPSLFLYTVLDEPLGGPAFFFVIGLAAGFGYNRQLLLPSVAEVADFPLVQEATGTLPAAETLDEELDRLGRAVPPRTGSLFLTAGVRFTSFGLIDSFVMVAVQLGRRTEIDVLGISRAVIPPPEAGAAIEPLAEIELALAARFLPDDGILEVRAQLTDSSYILSGDCRLHGGFAFFAWFGPEHAGDFALTLGGYHPHYVPEPHYPLVPKLGFDWRVDDHLSVGGSVYFALTPSVVMAGAHLHATFEKGSLSAWFQAGLDFLIAWKPYHYEARVQVSLGARYTYHFLGTHHLSISICADLELWGPPFAGRATLDFGIVSVTARFGPQVPPRPSLLSWADFRQAFLPADDDVCSIAVVNGLLHSLETDGIAYAVVDSSDLRVRVSSRVPVEGGVVGVGPVGVAEGGLQSTFEVDVLDEVGAPVAFERTTRRENVPAALWGGKARPGLKDATMVRDVPVGRDLTPTPSTAPAATAPLHAADLTFRRERIEVAADSPPDGVVWHSALLQATALGAGVADAEAAGRQRRVAREYGLDVRGAATAGLADALLEEPAAWFADALFTTEVA